MELKKLDKKVLKLWYIRAVIACTVPFCAIIGAIIIPIIAGASNAVILAVTLGIGIPAALILGFILVMPVLRYRMYAWGYDDKRITVVQGVILRQRVVIPVCQIQDLHRIQGPLMMMMGISGVTISTAGSNFDISTLTTAEADLMIDELEHNLATRIEELKNEEI